MKCQQKRTQALDTRQILCQDPPRDRPHDPPQIGHPPIMGLLTGLAHLRALTRLRVRGTAMPPRPDRLCPLPPAQRPQHRPRDRLQHLTTPGQRTPSQIMSAHQLVDLLRRLALWLLLHLAQSHVRPAVYANLVSTPTALFAGDCLLCPLSHQIFKLLCKIPNGRMRWTKNIMHL
jgi:hypothetical protein